MAGPINLSSPGAGDNTVKPSPSRILVDDSALTKYLYIINDRGNTFSERCRSSNVIVSCPAIRNIHLSRIVTTLARGGANSKSAAMADAPELGLSTGSLFSFSSTSPTSGTLLRCLQWRTNFFQALKLRSTGTSKCLAVQMPH